MNPHTIRRLFPNASAATIAANAQDYGTSEAENPWQATKLELHFGPRSLEAKDAQKTNPERVHIRFESVRKQLLDPDNLSPKWMLDAIRRIGLIEGDEPEKITLETSQRRAAKGEEEHTVITITYP